MENICADRSDLYIQLGLDRDGAIACWGEAKTSYEHSEEG